MNLDTLRITEAGLDLQDALRQMLSADDLTHWVTLHYHSPQHPHQAQRTLRLWSLDVTDRLFRTSRFAGQPIDQLFRFTALPENTRTDDPHYHLLARVHPDRHDGFNTCAGRFWKRIVASGTSDVQLIGSTALDHIKVLRYATKHSSRPFSYNEFITSNMLDLPAHGGRRTAPSPIARKQPGSVTSFGLGVP